MHCHCGTNNRAPRWTFTDPCKPEVRPGAREESASPAWLAAPAMNARDTTKVYIWRLDTGCGPTLYRKCHSHNTPEKGYFMESSTLQTCHKINSILTLMKGEKVKLIQNLFAGTCVSPCSIKLKKRFESIKFFRFNITKNLLQGQCIEADTIFSF